MSYVDAFVLPVPESNKRTYREVAGRMATVYRSLGAIAVLESWGEELQRGETTDFFRAVKAKDGETVVLSVVTWPSKTVRDAAWQAIMSDPAMKPQGAMPFDGTRMFWGGFSPLLQDEEPSKPQKGEESER